MENKIEKDFNLKEEKYRFLCESSHKECNHIIDLGEENLIVHIAIKSLVGYKLNLSYESLIMEFESFKEFVREKHKTYSSKEYKHFMSLDITAELLVEYFEQKYGEEGKTIVSDERYSRADVLSLMTSSFNAGFNKHDVVEAGLEGMEADTEVNWILNKFKK